MAIETYFKDIADAIRAKAGTSGLITPAQMPSAIAAIQSGVEILSGTIPPTSAQGINGQLYLEYTNIPGSISYCKMIIYSCFAVNIGAQLSEINILDANGNTIQYPAGTSIDSNYSSYTSSESIDNLIDGSVYTKFLSNGVPNSSNPLIITITLGQPLNTIRGWNWYAANDSEGRDPNNFDFLVSSNSTDWFLVSEGNISTSPARYAKAFEDIFDSGVTSAYAKVNGAWQNLIGTEISDIELGG